MFKPSDTNDSPRFHLSPMTPWVLTCACGQTRSRTLDIEIASTNGFESHLFVALDPEIPRGSPWPRVKFYSCRSCAVVYAQHAP